MQTKKHQQEDQKPHSPYTHPDTPLQNTPLRSNLQGNAKNVHNCAIITED